NFSKKNLFGPVLSKGSSINARIKFLLFLGFGIFLLNYFKISNPTYNHKVLAFLILLFSALPAFLYIGDKQNKIPFLPLFGVIYGIYYALPVFLLEFYKLHYKLGKKHILSDLLVEEALYLALIGLIVLLVSYYIFPGRVLERVIPRISIRWNLKKARIASVMMGVIGIAVYYFDITHRVPTHLSIIVQFIANFSFVSIAMFLILQFKGVTGFMEKFFFWCIIIPLRVFLGLSTGSIYSGLAVVLLFFLIYISHKKAIPWLLIILFVLTLLSLTAVKDDFRKLARSGEFEQKSVLEKALIFGNMNLKFVQNAQRIKQSEFFQKFTTRTNGLMTLAYVIKKTPEVIPYWNGYSYIPLLTKFIPRIIYPDKPQENVGHIFGKRYNILHKSDKGTSVNLHQLVEMYANYGKTGVILGMFFLGIIYKALIVMLGYEENGDGSNLIGFVIFLPLLWIESNLSMIVGGIFYQIILLIILNKMIAQKEIPETGIL
ncbi:MAG: hypothetical protein ABIB11_02635, partial [Candidatus Omnitrophota bacterium]